MYIEYTYTIYMYDQFTIILQLIINLTHSSNFSYLRTVALNASFLSYVSKSYNKNAKQFFKAKL